MSGNVWCPSRLFLARGRIRICLAVVVKKVVVSTSYSLPHIDEGSRHVRRHTSAKLDRQGGEDEGADNVRRSMVVYPNRTVSYSPLSGPDYKTLKIEVLTIDQSSSKSGGCLGIRVKGVDLLRRTRRD